MNMSEYGGGGRPHRDRRRHDPASRRPTRGLHRPPSPLTARRWSIRRRLIGVSRWQSGQRLAPAGVDRPLSPSRPGASATVEVAARGLERYRGVIHHALNNMNEGYAMTERTQCLVIGGGPAGMVAGLLLARAGVDVTVLEKHGDFLRDFRGDTVHPSTMQLLDELGLGEEFAKLPQSHLSHVQLPGADGQPLVVGDLSRLK